MFESGGWMGVGMWLFWILLIVFVVVILKAVTGAGTSSQADQRSPLELLKARYARGEIDKNTFELMRKDLE